MRRLASALFVAVMMLGAPISSSALTTAEIEAQIRELLAQAAALQARIHALMNASAVPAAGRPACPALSRVLSRGARGDDVTALQSFLLAHGYLQADSVTGFFGALTESAVRRFQAAQGIASSGSADTGWGVVGSRTRAAILSLCDESIPQNDTLTVSSQGLSLSAQVTVNTKGACTKSVYTLEWGDGSPSENITVPEHTCRLMQKTIHHTYAVGGSYTIVLKSPNSRIAAPIRLTAPSTCTNPEFIDVEAPPAYVGETWTLPVMFAKNMDTILASGQPGSLVLRKQDTTDIPVWVLSGVPTTTGTYIVRFSAQNSCSTVTRTIEVSVSSNRYRTCTPPPIPGCSGGTLQLRPGADSNGCMLGYQCVKSATSTSAL